MVLHFLLFFFLAGSSADGNLKGKASAAVEDEEEEPECPGWPELQIFNAKFILDRVPAMRIDTVDYGSFGLEGPQSFLRLPSSAASSLVFPDLRNDDDLITSIDETTGLPFTHKWTDIELPPPPKKPRAPRNRDKDKSKKDKTPKKDAVKEVKTPKKDDKKEGEKPKEDAEKEDESGNNTGEKTPAVKTPEKVPDPDAAEIKGNGDDDSELSKEDKSTPQKNDEDVEERV